jgi:hypothetical protein
MTTIMERRIFTVTFEEFAEKLGYNNFEKVNGWYVHQVLNEALVFWEEGVRQGLHQVSESRKCSGSCEKGQKC